MGTINLGDKGLTDGDVIDPYLEDYAGGSDTVVIPAGSYEWHGDDLDTGPGSIVGNGNPGDVTFNITQGTLDGSVAGDLENIVVRGDNPSPKAGIDLEENGVIDGVALTGKQTELEDRAFYHPDGGERRYLRNAAWGWCASDGAYLDKAIQTVDSVFAANCNISHVRLGHRFGTDTEATSYLSNSVIALTRRPPYNNEVDAYYTRGLRLREPCNLVVENCYFVWYDVTGDGGNAVELHDEAAGATVEFTNCHWYTESDTDLINDKSGGNIDVTINDCTVAGPGNHDVGVSSYAGTGFTEQSVDVPMPSDITGIPQADDLDAINTDMPPFAYQDDGTGGGGGGDDGGSGGGGGDDGGGGGSGGDDDGGGSGGDDGAEDGGETGAIANIQVTTREPFRVSYSFTSDLEATEYTLARERQALDGSFGGREPFGSRPIEGGEAAGTDDTVKPGRTYRYELRMEDADGVVYANTFTVTTKTTGDPIRPVERDGWDVEVERRSAGSGEGGTFSPTVVGDPEWVPRTNALPKVRVPVEKASRWTASEYEGQGVRVYKDGEMVAVDRLENVIVKADRVVLEARGGLELLGESRWNFRGRNARYAAEEVVLTDTSYATIFDDPAENTETDVTVADPFYESDYRALQPDWPPAADSPLRTRDLRLGLHETAHFTEAEYADFTFPNPDTNNYCSRGDGVSVFAAGHYVEHTFNVDYRLPAGDWKPAFLVYVPADHGGSEPAYELTVDGVTVATRANTNWLGDSFDGTLFWVDSIDSSGNDFALDAGKHTVRLEFTQDADAGDNIWVSALTLYDTRHTQDPPGAWYPNAGSVSPLEWPHEYPMAFDVETADINTTRQVTAGALEFAAGPTANEQAIAISNNDGESWTVSQNSRSVATEFAGPNPQIRARFTLSVYEQFPDAETVSLKYNGEPYVHDYTVTASLSDIPTLRNVSYHGQTIEVLRSIADYGDFVFEVRRVNGQTTVVWTQPGQRSQAVEDAIVDYEFEKNNEQSYDRVVVKGSPVPARSEPFTANYGTWTSLEYADIKTGSESVYDPSTDTQYDRGADYKMDYLDGRIRVLDNGSMADGADYEVDYERRVVGAYEAPTAGPDPETKVEKLPGLTTPQSCEQAAFYLFKKVQEPVYSIRFTVEDIDPSVSVVESLGVPEAVAPHNEGALVPKEIINAESKTVIEAGTRNEYSDIVEDMQARLDSVTDRV
jgi:uncharacterized membrane protein YgcG